VIRIVHHPITGEPILHAPTRAERPRAFADAADDARCPFCPGHESDTPPEIARVGDPWRVRVFPNKYPPIDGAEVIVESPRHDAALHDVDLDEVLRVYIARLRAHEDAAHIALFRNDGPRAGASIAHLHAQLVPLPFIPPRVASELDAFARACPLCDARGVVIRETATMQWLVPATSMMPYQQWLVPKRHVATICDLGDDELRDLASLMRHASRATHTIGDANSIFMNFPRASNGHAYIEILPRITTIAGLELGSGTFVEIVEPDAAAARLRENA